MVSEPLDLIRLSYGLSECIIIASTLQSLFPEWAFDAVKFRPVTWPAFIEEVLVPETLMLLIQQDQHISLSDAAQMLQDTEVRTLPVLIFQYITVPAFLTDSQLDQRTCTLLSPI